MSTYNNIIKENSETNTNTFELPKLRLAKFEIGEDIAGVEMKVEKETCHRMVYFLSFSPNVGVMNRPNLKGIHDLIFPTKEHDVTSKLLEKRIKTGSVVNLDENIYNMRVRYYKDEKIYLYVWCPFLEGTHSTTNEVRIYDFKLSFRTNQNKIENVNEENYKNQLNFQIRNENLGKSETSSTSQIYDVYEKIKNDILSSENSSTLIENIENLSKNNFGVMETEIDIRGKLKENEEFKVVTVIIILINLIILA